MFYNWGWILGTNFNLHSLTKRPWSRNWNWSWSRDLFIQSKMLEKNPVSNYMNFSLRRLRNVILQIVSPISNIQDSWRFLCSGMKSQIEIFSARHVNNLTSPIPTYYSGTMSNSTEMISIHFDNFAIWTGAQYIFISSKRHLSSMSE